MKTIKTLIEIPAEYKWKATDANGTVCLYTHKPKIAKGGEFGPSFQEWEPTGGDWLDICKGSPCSDWENSLQRIYEYEEVE